MPSVENKSSARLLSHNYSTFRFILIYQIKYYEIPRFCSGTPSLFILPSRWYNLTQSFLRPPAAPHIYLSTLSLSAKIEWTLHSPIGLLQGISNLKSTKWNLRSFSSEHIFQANCSITHLFAFVRNPKVAIVTYMSFTFCLNFFCTF